ncbi:ATP-dependent DNA ligase [Candidatus Micrarchaeota archaeon]|nr:ATP-dependent DNA ligase [Candidatus Micrarchaeota archaeon]
MEFRKLAEAFEHLEGTSSRLQMTDMLAELFKDARPDEADRIAYLLQGMVAPPFAGIEIGIGEKFVEQAVALATGYPVREVEKLYRDLGDLGSVAERLIEKKKQASLVKKTLSITDVFNSFRKIALAGGAGSQNIKIRTLAELLNNSSPLEARYFCRIPLGRLRLGVGDPTVLDALSVMKKGDKTLRPELERAYNLCSDLGLVARTFMEKGEKGLEKFELVPGNPVRPALAERLSSAREIIDKIGKCAVESKYDGFRLGIHKWDGKIRLFSRRLEDMTSMFPDIVDAVKALKAKEIIFEGEALAFNETTGEYRPFQETIQRKRKHGIAEKVVEFPLHVFAFDVLYLNGRDLTGKPYEERREMLEKLFSGAGVITPSEMQVISRPEKLEAFFDDAVSRGLEGVIAKDLRAPYVAGARKFAWIKLKRSYRGELADTIDVVVVGYYKGRGSRAQFGFGGLLTCVYDGETDEFKTIARIGSGFSEQQMGEFRKTLDAIKVPRRPARVDSLYEPDYWVEPKYVVTVKADEITKSPLHTCGRDAEGIGYALRFPRLISDLGRDKKPEDATTVAEIREMYNMQKRISASEGEA